MRRHDHKRREVLRCSQTGERLYGLAQSHFVRQQRARVRQQEGQPLLLEFAQRAAERPLRRGRAQGQLHRRLALHSVLARLLQRFFPERPVPLGDFQRVTHHQPVDLADDAAIGGKARLAALALAARKQTLGHLGHAWLALDCPAPAAPVVGKPTIYMPLCGCIAQIGREIIHNSSSSWQADAP